MGVAERILGLMDERGVKAAQLTRELSLSHGVVTQWKQGLQKPSAEAVVKIADFFGTTTDYLLKGGERQTEYGKGVVPMRRNLTEIAESVSLKYSSLISRVGQIESLTHFLTVQSAQEVEAAFLEAEDKAEELNRKFEIIKKSVTDALPVEYRVRGNPSVVIVDKKSDDAEVIADFENAAINGKSDTVN